MRRIVVSYNSDGGYECGSYLNIHRIMYESAEKWLMDFELALDEAIAKRKIIDEEYKKWQKEEPKHGSPLYLEWLRRDPYSGRTDYFEFGGQEWLTTCFYQNLPEVLELEEWHERSQVC